MHRKIAVIFDFDDTLAHDSTTDLLESLGIDTLRFWGVFNRQLLDAGWDPVPAYMYQMLEWSRTQPAGNRITCTRLEAAGKTVRFFDGVTRLFGRLSEYVEKTDPSFTPEFYIISSGLGDLIRSTRVARFMTDIFASDFHYNGAGEIEFPRKIVSFTDKTRYIFQISKGLIGREFQNRPFDVNKKVNQSELRIPLENMIFIGDGYTDVPCFSLLNKNRGTALAVYDRENTEKKHRAWGFIEDGRVKNLHSADYSGRSDLVSSIEMSIGSIIARSKNAYQG